MTAVVFVNIWCALNSTFGGPLLAIITVGGILYIGRTLVEFPEKFSDSDFENQQVKNSGRGVTWWVGILALLAVITNAVLYVVAYGYLRSGGQACPSATINDVQFSVLFYFFACTVAACIIGLVYSIMLASLRKK